MINCKLLMLSFFFRLFFSIFSVLLYSSYYCIVSLSQNSARFRTHLFKLILKKYIIIENFSMAIQLCIFPKKIIYIFAYRQLKVACCFFIQNCNNLFFPSSHHFEKAKTPIECIFDEDKEYLFHFDWIEKKKSLWPKEGK